jgi:hypothetical protein
MHTRTLLNAGVFVLLLVLTIEVAGMSRSLRRIEHEERRLVTHCVAERPTLSPLHSSYVDRQGF